MQPPNQSYQCNKQTHSGTIKNQPCNHNNSLFPTTTTTTTLLQRTDDVIVVHALELVAPQVGRELLELDGEAALARGLVARQDDVGRPGHLAAVRLFP